MKISIVTLFPDMLAGFFSESIIKRAQEKKLVSIDLVNLRQFAIDSYGTVDDRPYGGGAGMLTRVDVLAAAVRSVTKGKVIYTTPRGKKYNQSIASSYAKENHLILLAGHYEGIDERASAFIDEEISVGDFVMTGGEIAVAAIVDSVVRLVPGVLKKETATAGESFGEVELAELMKLFPEDSLLLNLSKKGMRTVKLLEYPQYTRPSEFEGNQVPEVVTTGDPKKIRAWQLARAYEETIKRRPDLLEPRS